MTTSLLRPTYTSDQVTIKIKIPKPEHSKMNEYMQWAGFESESDFVRQAIQFIFESDKEFKKSHKIT